MVLFNSALVLLERVVLFAHSFMSRSRKAGLYCGGVLMQHGQKSDQCFHTAVVSGLGGEKEENSRFVASLCPPPETAHTQQEDKLLHPEGEMFRNKQRWPRKPRDDQLSCSSKLRVLRLPLLLLIQPCVYVCLSQRWVYLVWIFWSYPTPLTPRPLFIRGKSQMCSLWWSSVVCCRKKTCGSDQNKHIKVWNRTYIFFKKPFYRRYISMVPWQSSWSSRK